MEEARAEITEVLRIDPKYTVKVVPRSFPWKDQAEIDRLIDSLRKAGLKSRVMNLQKIPLHLTNVSSSNRYPSQLSKIEDKQEASDWRFDRWKSGMDVNLQFLLTFLFQSSSF